MQIIFPILMYILTAIAAEVQGPAGLRTISDYNAAQPYVELRNWDCPGNNFIKTFTTYSGDRISIIEATCTDGTQFSISGYTDNRVSITDNSGFYQLMVLYDKCSLCRTYIFAASTAISTSSGGAGSCGSPCSSPTVTTMKCNAGEKITGFGVDPTSANWRIALHCNPIQCTGSEISPTLCSCPATGTYQAGTSCPSCPGCSTGEYRSGCGGGSPGACVSCTNLPGGNYYTGEGGLNNNNCPYTGCPTCGVGQYRSGCGGASSGFCTSCTNLPSPAYYYTTDGGQSNSCGYAACTACSIGEQNQGCSGTSAGSCVACSTPPVGAYIKDPGSCGIYPCPERSCGYGMFNSCGGNSEGLCKPCSSAGTYDYYTPTQSVFSASQCTFNTVPVGFYRNIAHSGTPYSMTLPSASDLVGGVWTYQYMVNNQPYFKSNGNYHLWWYKTSWLFGLDKGYVGGQSGFKLGPVINDQEYNDGQTFIPSPLITRATNIVWYRSCGTGTFSPSQGLSTCTQCAAGSYASQSGLSACTSCAAGKFVSQTGDFFN